MRKAMVLLLACIVAGLVAPAVADWDLGDPYKWVRYPDLAETGIDVNATRVPGQPSGFILADDFRCMRPGPITNIHLWGSWLNDHLPWGYDSTAVVFKLSFHKDIPDSLSPTGYSMPGDLLWYRTFMPGQYTARVWSDSILEGWLDPPNIYNFPADSTCWQYNFTIDSADAFYQLGSPDSPAVYWLDVQARPDDPAALFGWKTTLGHWNDDAVWGWGVEPYQGSWWELRYPPNHEMYGQSMDLAFVLVTPASAQRDWGDAPDGAVLPGYPTLAVNNGANHIIAGPWLGGIADTRDAEPDGQPNPNALGDDLNASDDEDGVSIPPLVLGQVSTITMEVHGGGGVVNAWIDFNGDRSWQPIERVFAGLVPDGITSFAVTPPPIAVAGQTCARFRISTAGGLLPEGPASDGEVEDHVVFIEEHSWKWIQHPDLGPLGIDVNATDPYILADDFMCREPGYITEIGVWGSWRDDYLPFEQDPRAVTFTLSIHGDIPESLSATGYSMPESLLWLRTFPPGTFSVQVWKDSISEGWMTPPEDYVFPGDHVCWLYTFPIALEDAFFQRGTPDSSRVYWLDVQAEPHDGAARFGWKTSWQHWNDDGVWGQGNEPHFSPWYELLYPPGHERYGHSIDLAFRILSEIHVDVPGGTAPPARFGLQQNVPNPCHLATEIRYELPASGRVSLEIFDIQGRLVCTVVDAVQTAGPHAAVWNGRDARERELPSGVYFYRLRVAGSEETRKMLLLN